MALREKHGFTGGAATDWSKKVLAKPEGELLEDMPKQYDRNTNSPPNDGMPHPKNEPLFRFLEEKFAWCGFTWRVQTADYKVGKGEEVRTRQWVEYNNYPRIGGLSMTLTDLYLLPVELFDGYNDEDTRTFRSLVGQPASANFLAGMERIAATGVGYKGLSGVSWLPGLTEMVFDHKVEARTVALGEAIFALTDAVAALWESEPGLRVMLSYKVPDRIPRITARHPVRIIRPDIVLVNDGDSYRPVCTELESCPAGQGMTHAMQRGYGLSTDMVDEFVVMLDGRPFTVVATNEWSEYVWDQGAFVAALRQLGVDARLVFDRPLSYIQDQVAGNGPLAWKAPSAAGQAVAQAWNTDFLGRLNDLGWTDFVSGGELPDKLEGVAFRFGYFDNFGQADLQKMFVWLEQGLDIINGLDFFHESKVLMAAIGLPAVGRWIVEHYGEPLLEVLDQCVATTRLLHPNFCDLDELRGHRPYWLSKFAAWDGRNQSWGSRSIDLGSAMSTEGWNRSLDDRLRLPHPVVVQHIIKSAQFSRPYVNGQVNLMTGGRIRVTPFLLRRKDGTTVHAGSTATLRAGTFRIHGATDALEMPIRFS